ncbi:MAG TPA: hypothetical protein VFW86_05465, partial [Candidatus Limnocylindrales bacterium]|nr:hypothetical protein [Candidatus Limnocylindrales bacterium]
MSARLTAPDLFRGLGLSVDGPATWGATPRSTGPGLYAVEWPAPEPRAPLDDRALRTWLDHVPQLRLDGLEPTPHDLGERIASFWLADQTVLFLGLGPRSLKGRLAAIYATPLGDRRPYAGGHWLKTLRGLERARVWWAETDAAEEYLDAALDAFADAVGEAGRLPFANLSSPGGDHRAHGVTDALRDPTSPPDPAAGQPTRTAAGGRRGSPPRRTAAGAGRSSATPRPTRAPRPKPPGRPAAEPTYVSADGMTRARSELAELRDARRP